MSSKMIFYRLLVFSVAVFSLSSCGLIVLSDEYSKVTPGPWRGVIQLNRQPLPINKKAKPEFREYIKFEEVASGEVPFMLDIQYDENDDLIVKLENDDIVQVEDIYYGLDRRTAYDTIRLKFKSGDEIKAVTQEGIIEGDWYKDGSPIHFVAKQGKQYRFTPLRKEPVKNIIGDYILKSIDATYSKEKIDSVALKITKQTDNLLIGDIVLGGKSRRLKGSIQADKFYLSRFDGEHAILLEGKVFENGEVSGALYVDKRIDILWIASK